MGNERLYVPHEPEDFAQECWAYILEEPEGLSDETYFNTGVERAKAAGREQMMPNGEKIARLRLPPERVRIDGKQPYIPEYPVEEPRKGQFLTDEFTENIVREDAVKDVLTEREYEVYRLYKIQKVARPTDTRLKKFNAYTQEEISELLGITQQTVQEHIEIIVRKLKASGLWLKKT